MSWQGQPTIGDGRMAAGWKEGAISCLSLLLPTEGALHYYQLIVDPRIRLALPSVKLLFYHRNASHPILATSRGLLCSISSGRSRLHAVSKNATHTTQRPGIQCLDRRLRFTFRFRFRLLASAPSAPVMSCPVLPARLPVRNSW